MLAMSARGCRGHRRHTVTVALWSVGNVRSPHRRASHALDDGRPREVKKTLESRRCSHDLDGLQQYPVSLLHGIRLVGMINGQKQPPPCDSYLPAPFDLFSRIFFAQ